MAVCQNLVPLVNIKIAGKWMFIQLKMLLIGIDQYPYLYIYIWKGHLRLPDLTKTQAGLGAPCAAAVRTDPGRQRRADSATMAEPWRYGRSVRH
jgi:hypothetical protein